MVRQRDCGYGCNRSRAAERDSPPSNRINPAKILMPLRIAFDLDGVLADMDSELVRQAEFLFGQRMTRCLQDRVETTPAPPGETATRGTAAEETSEEPSE